MWDRCISAFQYVFHVYVMKEFHNFVPGHGPQTGRCVPSDRHQDRWPDLKETSDFTSSSSYSLSVCEIQSWCPVEDDRCEIDWDIFCQGDFNFHYTLDIIVNFFWEGMVWLLKLQTSKEQINCKIFSFKSNSTITNACLWGNVSVCLSISRTPQTAKN